jgi:hypothetical protein
MIFIFAFVSGVVGSSAFWSFRFHAGWYRVKHYEAYGVLRRLDFVWGATTGSDNSVCVVAHHKALRAGRSVANFMCRGLTVNYQQ